MRAAMDADLGLLIVRCPGCTGALVRRPDPLGRATRRSALFVRTMLLLAVRGFALALAMGWCIAVVVILPELFFLDRFGSWRDGAGLGTVFGGGIDERLGLFAVSGAGFVAGAAVRVVWGHRAAWFAVAMFLLTLALALSVEVIGAAQMGLWNWAQGGNWHYFGPGREEWLGRGATAALGAPGFVVGWFVGGLMRGAINWDERRRWRRKLAKRRKRAHA